MFQGHLSLKCGVSLSAFLVVLKKAPTNGGTNRRIPADDSPHVIAIQRNPHPIWYRVRLMRCALGSTLAFPLTAHSLEEARVRALEHYQRRHRDEEVEVLQVERLAPVA
tara:strand:- start:3184 stop:3510 length:327 start_codon:yes stop_codon:yes gene_type:complete